mmetsp:Transcript_2543/g.6887  ORF Transcript_2543/g.6887 Transcript_2543/m.6887 type:complete len:228 (-) Transcript_2543:2227-2910(-)
MLGPDRLEVPLSGSLLVVSLAGLELVVVRAEPSPGVGQDVFPGRTGVVRGRHHRRQLLPVGADLGAEAGGVGDGLLGLVEVRVDQPGIVGVGPGDRRRGLLQRVLPPLEDPVGLQVASERQVLRDGVVDPRLGRSAVVVAAGGATAAVLLAVGEGVLDRLQEILRKVLPEEGRGHGRLVLLSVAEELSQQDVGADQGVLRVRVVQEQPLEGVALDRVDLVVARVGGR